MNRLASATSSQLTLTSPTPKLVEDVIDAILDHVVAAWEEWELGPRTPFMHEMKCLSLVSREWRRVVQRRIFRRLVISTGSRAQRVIEELGASPLQFYVRELVLQFSSVIRIPGRHIPSTPNDQEGPGPDTIKAADGATLDQFVALLLLFPNVTSLSIYPIHTELRSSDLINLQASPFLPHLSSLRITTQRWHVRDTATRDLLTLTPNLTFLALDCRGIITTKPPIKRHDPVHLPLLTSLELWGYTYALSLIDHALLSATTFSQITTLHWSLFGCYKPPPTDTSLFTLIGPKLRTLSYHTNSPNRDTAADLDLCPFIEELTLDLDRVVVGSNLFSHILHMTHTLTLDTEYNLRNTHILVSDLSPETRPTTLQKIVLNATFGEGLDGYESNDQEIAETLGYERRMFRELAEACERIDVELVVSDKAMKQELEAMKLSRIEVATTRERGPSANPSSATATTPEE